MALDEAVLDAHAAGEVPPTLRIYTWRPAAISLGRFQSIESSVDLDACHRLGLDVVRRPTGGRAILHTEEEVTFSLVVSEERLETSGVMESYRALAEGIVAGLRSLDLDANLVGRSAPSPALAHDPACFAVKARCDVVVGSSKLVGCAQVHRRGYILQQNSLPLKLQLEDWDGVFLRQSLPPAATGLWEAARREIPYAEVAQALRDGFSETLGVVFEESHVSTLELSRTRALVGRAGVLGNTTGMASV